MKTLKTVKTGSRSKFSFLLHLFSTRDNPHEITSLHTENVLQELSNVSLTLASLWRQIRFAFD